MQKLRAYKDSYGSTNPDVFSVGEECPIYGTSRFGITRNSGGSITSTQYQFTDHLGNVRAVVNDNEVVTNYADYYPFGMQLPERILNSADGYRYGYQGEFAEKEDPESTGTTNSFELRLWDARIGRWLTTDPANQYASPYLGMGNNPINGVDPDGAFWEELGNWVAGNGWNTNAALEFQANGGTLAEWNGGFFDGHRKGYRTEDGNPSLYRFEAKKDFWSGLHNKIDLGGNIGIGYTKMIGADHSVLVGLGGNINQTSMMFLGGDYGYYWYDYVGIQGGFTGGATIGSQINGTYELQLAISANLLGDNLPLGGYATNPQSYQGNYFEGSFYVGPEALVGGAIGISGTAAEGWLTIGLGISISAGPELSAMEIRAHGGRTGLITPVIPTSNRNIFQIIGNHMKHIKIP